MKKYILSAIIISAVCIFASCEDKNNGSQAENQSSAISDDVQTPTEQDYQPETESQSEFSIDAEIAAELFGRWEAISIFGQAEYNGIPAAVLKQWQFFDDGTCIFYMNGIDSEKYTFSLETDGIIRLVSDDENTPTYDFELRDNTLVQIEAETDSETYLQKTDEFTTIDSNTFENAF